MRTFAFAVAFTLFSATAAQASPFRDTPPLAMKLLAAHETPLSAPPLVDSPATAAPPPQTKSGASAVQPPSQSPSSSDAAVEIKVDPYAGTFVGKEVAVGAGAVLLTDIGCGLIGAALGLGLAAATGSFNNASNLTAFIALGVVLMSLVDVAVAPLMAAVGAYSVASKQGNNGLLGGALGAYVVQGATIVAGIIVYAIMAGIVFALSPSLSGGTANSGALIFVDAMSGLFSLIGLGVHFIGLPMGASFGIHWAGAVNKRKVNGFTRRPEILPGRPDELYGRASIRALSVPLAAFVF